MCDFWCLGTVKGCSMSALYFPVLLSNSLWSISDLSGHTSGFHFGHLKMILLWVFANICVWTQAPISQAAMSAVLGHIRRNR